MTLRAKYYVSQSNLWDIVILKSRLEPELEPKLNATSVASPSQVHSREIFHDSTSCLNYGKFNPTSELHILCVVFATI